MVKWMLAGDERRDAIAAVAQLVEQALRKRQVVCSSQTSGTKKVNGCVNVTQLFSLMRMRWECTIPGKVERMSGAHFE